MGRTIATGAAPATAEQELLARAKRGDDDAFTALLRLHDAKMRRLTSRLLGGRVAMDDALQDAYLKAYRRLDSFDGRSAFSTWLYSVTYRTCLDYLRVKDRRREVNLDHASQLPSNEVEPGHRLADRSALQEALLALPVDQAAAVLLVDGEGLSYDEAADVLDVAHGTVASRVSRARAALREHLLRDEPGGLL